MKKISTVVVVWIIALFFSAEVFALMPPFTKKELKQESNMIVKGIVTNVVCSGEIKDTGCAVLTGYIATLEVNRVIKGKKYKDVKLRFKDYNFKKGCIGSPDARHYTGDAGRYYLKCNEDNCRLTHWNGVEHTQRGKSSLPKCSK